MTLNSEMTRDDIAKAMGIIDDYKAHDHCTSELDTTFSMNQTSIEGCRDMLFAADYEGALTDKGRRLAFEEIKRMIDASRETAKENGLIPNVTGEIENRCERAKVAIHEYVLQKGEAYEDSIDEITDLITDLLHLAEQMEGAPEIEGLINRAKGHWDSERIDAILENGESL